MWKAGARLVATVVGLTLAVAGVAKAPTDLGALRAKAEHGNAQAQVSLGDAHEDGKGVTRDSAAAVKWYRKAADQGIAKAQFHLGVMNKLGDGVAKDEARALKWYLKTANQVLLMRSSILA